MIKKEMVKDFITKTNIIQRCIDSLDYLYLDNNLKSIIKESAESRAAELENLLIEFYDKKFSYEELDDILKFLNSDAGKKFMEYTTKEDRDLISLSTNWLKDVMEESDRQIQSELLKQKIDKGIAWKEYIPPIEDYSDPWRI